MNRYEKLVYRNLKKRFQDFDIKIQYRPAWMKNPITNRNLELDFYIVELKLGIEVQGKYHLWKKQIRNDHIKRTLCKKRGITLLELWMPVTVTRVNKAVDNFLGGLPII